ncbi:MAG TPA: TPM domain-containing protein [Smithellaceae bacterium]|nr:TPM domain-containing protein [Smithellaceae bacterium]
MNDKQLNFLENRNRILPALWAVLLLIILATGAPAAETYPQPTGMAVNDFARVIDPENTAKMESLAREILQKTGASVVVATVATMGENEEVSMYVNGLYKAWGIGKKGEDRGVLIFLAVKERKIRIETGYGVEGVLPDGLVGEILDKYVVPHLRAGETGKAMYNAMFACGTYIAKDKGVELTGVATPYRTKAKPQKKGISIGAVIVFLICAAVLLGTRTGREMLPWILLLLMSGGRGGGRDDGFGGGFDGFGGGASGGGGAGRDF